MSHDLREQRPGRPGDELDPDVGVPSVIAGDDRGQSRRRGALQRTEPEHSARLAMPERCFGLRGKPQQPVGVGEQQPALGREHQPPPVAQEERHPQPLLELFYSRGHVGRHAMELRGRLRNAAFRGHGPEDLEPGEVHRSHIENKLIPKIHFSQ